MIRHLQVFGERKSGTSYLVTLIKKNFSSIRVTSLFGYKHWFIRDHFPRSRPNETTDLECERSLDNSDDTLFLVIYRNPFDWLQSFHKMPYHGDGHWGLEFSEFIRKPWVSYTTEKLHKNWKENKENYYFIE